MKAWVDSVLAFDGGDHALLGTMQLADWLALDTRDPSGRQGYTDGPFVAYIYLWQSTQIVADTAYLLGKMDDHARYDAEADGFVFDANKLEALSQLNVRSFAHCRDCFCKWHCAGDCAAKVLDGKRPEEHVGSVRCEVNRALTLDQIRDMLDRSPSKERGEPDGR